MEKFPSYRELLSRTDAPAGSSWGVFGQNDQLGTLNHLTTERALAATQLVKDGRCFNLDLALDAFDPPISHRSAPRHKIFQNAAYHRDDILDDFYLQGTTQVDSLRHMKHPKYGFYNGVSDAEIAVGNPALGIGLMAERGIVGRGVLIDVESYLESQGLPLDQRGPSSFTVQDLDAAAHNQGVTLEYGDILLVRTGYISYVLGAPPEEREFLAKNVRSVGLVQSHESVEWLWDKRISLFACDNLAAETVPTVRDSPFRTDPDLKDLVGTHEGMMHPILLAMLGLPLGELWHLDELAQACRADNRWDFLLTCHPLNLRGGVGSPANALAIR